MGKLCCVDLTTTVPPTTSTYDSTSTSTTCDAPSNCTPINSDSCYKVVSCNGGGGSFYNAVTSIGSYINNGECITVSNYTGPECRCTCNNAGYFFDHTQSSTGCNDSRCSTATTLAPFCERMGCIGFECIPISGTPDGGAAFSACCDLGCCGDCTLTTTKEPTTTTIQTTTTLITTTTEITTTTGVYCCDFCDENFNPNPGDPNDETGCAKTGSPPWCPFENSCNYGGPMTGACYTACTVAFGDVCECPAGCFWNGIECYDSNDVYSPCPYECSLSPTTQAPTTVAPTTVAPTTAGPTTVGPTTAAPTTAAPTTVAPTTVAPTTTTTADCSGCYKQCSLRRISPKQQMCCQQLLLHLPDIKRSRSRLQ